MSNFLTGLLNRAKGMEVTLQRRRPSLFEPDIGLLAARGGASELSSGETETDHEQINTNVRRDIGSVSLPSVGVSAQSSPYITPGPAVKPTLPTDVSIRLPEQHATDTQFPYNKNKPGIESGEDINHMEQAQTAREMQIEKHTRPAELNAADSRADGMTERLIERVVPMTSLQRIETIREFQIEKPRSHSLTDADNSPAMQAKAVTSAESAAKAPTMPTPLGNQEKVVQAEVRVTPLQIPKIDGLSPKPKEQIVRDISTMSASRVEHNTRRESANFAETQHMTEAAPTIQVTIGRIEVRATQQSANSSGRSTRPLAPRLSLEDYLRQRHGGGR